MSNDQQNPIEQPAAQPQDTTDILREAIENPWGLPPLTEDESPDV